MRSGVKGRRDNSSFLSFISVKFVNLNLNDSLTPSTLVVLSSILLIFSSMVRILPSAM